MFAVGRENLEVRGVGHGIAIFHYKLCVTFIKADVKFKINKMMGCFHTGI